MPRPPCSTSPGARRWRRESAIASKPAYSTSMRRRRWRVATISSCRISARSIALSTWRRWPRSGAGRYRRPRRHGPLLRLGNLVVWAARPAHGDPPLGRDEFGRHRRPGDSDPLLDSPRHRRRLCRLRCRGSASDRAVPAALRSVFPGRAPSAPLAPAGPVGGARRLPGRLGLLLRPSSDSAAAEGRLFMILFYNPVSSASKKPVLPMSLLAVEAMLEGRED